MPSILSLLHRVRCFVPGVLLAFAIAFSALPLRAAETPATKITLADVAVPGYKLKATDYVSSPKMISKDDTVRGPALSLRTVPFPRTSKPVTVYLRVRPGHEQDEFIPSSMDAREQNRSKRLDTARAPKIGEWQWIHFKPLTHAVVGDRLQVEAFVNRKASGAPTEISDLVLSTNPNLDDAALESTPPLFPAGPLARVNEAKTAPVIDGREEDAAWKNAVAIKDFGSFGALLPASQPTSVRLMYDDKNLYVLFHNTEPLLIASDMRGSEIKAQAKTRDGDTTNGKLVHDVINDDACAIMLQPRAGGPVYEFIVNEKGVMSDARMERRDLWATRDLSWNSKFEAAAREGNGFWTLEMAIPLEDIGASSPKAGESWQAIIVRNAAGRKEISSWNPSNAGSAHRPVEMGTLVFGEPQISVVPSAPLQTLQPGLNDITAQIAAVPPESLRFVSRVQSGSDKAYFNQGVFAAPEQGASAQYQFEVAASGTASARWGVLDAATMQPVYFSPQMNVSVQSQSLAMKLSTPGAFELIVNDHVVAKGDKAAAQDLKFPLRAGANVIALRAEAGTATVALDAPGLERFDSVWRANDATAPNATAAKLDDRKWPLVKADAGSTLTAAGPTVFRRTILVDQTPVWPVPQPALYIAGNSAQHVGFLVPGLNGKVLENWTTYLAVPKALQVLGSTGYYGTTRDAQPEFLTEAAGETTVDGQTLSLYKITANKPLTANRIPIMSFFQVFLKIADNSQAKAGVAWKLHYWSQADDGTVIEAPRSIEVRALPPLNGKQPKKLTWELWGSYFSAMDSEPLRRATFETMRSAGFNSIMAGDRWTSDNGQQYGVANAKMVNFKDYSINLAPYLKDHPDERLIGHNGKPANGVMCTTLLVGDHWKVAAPILADIIQKANPANVNYDYEYSPLTGPHSCYCDRCLAAFRERAKIAADVNLTPRIIEDQYLAQWQDFMAYRAAQILAKMKGTVHATLPGVPFATYSLFQSPRSLAIYGIDWRYVGQLKAVDIAEAGLGRPLDEIEATYKALDGIPLRMGVWMTPYSPDDLAPARVTTKAELLRRSLDATEGMLVYDRNPLDGRSWTAIAETTRLIADYESTFIAHHLAEIPGQNSANVQLLKGDKESLLCVMNESSQPVQYRFRLPAELGPGREYYSGQTVTAAGELQITLAPGDTAVYILK
jgi:hypothetical protein